VIPELANLRWFMPFAMAYPSIIHRGLSVVLSMSNFMNIERAHQHRKLISWSCGTLEAVRGTGILDPYFTLPLTVSFYSIIQQLYKINVILIQGIILIHDLTNRKSEQNLRKWLAEVLTKECNSTFVRNPSARNQEVDDFDPEQFIGSSQVANQRV